MILPSYNSSMQSLAVLRLCCNYSLDYVHTYVIYGGNYRNALYAQTIRQNIRVIRANQFCSGRRHNSPTKELHQWKNKLDNEKSRWFPFRRSIETFLKSNLLSNLDAHKCYISNSVSFKKHSIHAQVTSQLFLEKEKNKDSNKNAKVK